MALIKCEVCEQMVSDKATACPHCGCPVKRPLVCPECGETVSEGDSYCLKCGCPLNQNTQPQAEEQVNYSWGDEEEKPNNTLKWLLGILAALVVLGGAALYAWQSGMFNKSATLEDTVAVDSTPSMAAPVIELNGEGMFSIDDCPTTYEGLEIVKHEGEYGLSSIDVILDGKQLCSFTFKNDDNDLDNNDYVTGDQVHFLDANFDGYVDIFLGPGCDREYSALFLWDPEQSKFVRVREDGNLQFNGNYQFHPASQKVYYTGSGSFSSNHAVRLSWQNYNLQSEEALTSEMLNSRLDENQPAKYVVRKGVSGKIIFSTDDPNKIPAQWKKWAYVPTGEDAKQYEEDDIEDEGTPDYDYSTDNDEITQARGEMIEIETQIQREKNKFMSYYEKYRSLMQQYGTTSPDPYLYDNLMGVINRIIELSDKGEKAAMKAGNSEMAENYRKDARMCRNAKNQLIMQH